MRRGERDRERRPDDDDEEDDDEDDRDDEGLRRRRECPPRRRPRDRLRPRFASNSSSRSAAAIASELIWGLRFCVFVAATDAGGATTGAGAGAWKRLGFGRLMVFAGLTGAGGRVFIQLGRLSTVASRCPPGQFMPLWCLALICLLRAGGA